MQTQPVYRMIVVNGAPIRLGPYCVRCSADIPPTRRRGSAYCSVQCRKAASMVRYRGKPTPRTYCPECTHCKIAHGDNLA